MRLGVLEPALNGNLAEGGEGLVHADSPPISDLRRRWPWPSSGCRACACGPRQELLPPASTLCDNVQRLPKQGGRVVGLRPNGHVLVEHDGQDHVEQHDGKANVEEPNPNYANLPTDLTHLTGHVVEAVPQDEQQHGSQRLTWSAEGFHAAAIDHVSCDHEHGKDSDQHDQEVCQVLDDEPQRPGDSVEPGVCAEGLEEAQGGADGQHSSVPDQLGLGSRRTQGLL
mmetsp:Transcript_77602/g.201835  ORF Transcript_77602/g.201835 Transcript_77602/m.201835 type:complete len:226 (+) Transcript_77602:1093-1770(+)